MSKQGRLLFLKFFMGFLILILINPILNSRVTYNWSECTVQPGCDGSEKVSGTSINLGVYVVQSAGHFLNSYSSWNTFLNRVEMAELNGLDYKELREILYTAIEEMEKANALYSDISTAAGKSVYVQSVIDCLIAFDYKTFQKEKGLNAVVFKEVTEYLEAGDIRGIYSNAMQTTGQILDRLYEVKVIIETDTFPKIEGLWEINQEYAVFGLFGQYVSQVCYAVLYSK